VTSKKANTEERRATQNNARKRRSATHRATRRPEQSNPSPEPEPIRHGQTIQLCRELVTAGLSVTEALATATSGAAQACGVRARKGRLAPGYDADLLVVDGDLEIDVTALHRLRSVLLRGLPLSI